MPIGSLWLPGLVSAVVVFVTSSVLHMVLTYHRADHKPLPQEDAIRDVLGKASLAPGVYFTPHCKDHKAINEPANLAKFEKGPVAIITVYPNGAPKMQKHLALWFGFCLAVSFTAAYVARHTLQPNALGMEVMRITGTVAFAAYCLSQASESIWKGQPWSNTFRMMLDGVIYAVVTGLVFRLLWPSV
jgi:hypothetical protein